MQSGQAWALPLPPLLATPCTLLLCGQCRPATSLRRGEGRWERQFQRELSSISDTRITPGLENSGLAGGDGGESNSPSKQATETICYRYSRWFDHTTGTPNRQGSRSPARWLLVALSESSALPSLTK